MIKTVIMIIALVLIIIEQVILIYKYFKPHGILHIDEYQDKDVYRLLYLIPVENLKKYRRFNFKVEVQKWSGLSEMPEGDYEIFN